MGKIKFWLSLLLVVALSMAAFTGCAEKNGKAIYSEGIDKNGFFDGIKALDYVDLGEYKGISIPREVYEIPEEAIQAQLDAILANYVTETQTTPPELTDEFVAKNMSSEGYSTVSELKEAIRSSMQSTAMFDYIRKYLIENITVRSVPESLVLYQENTLIQAYQESADFYKMDLNDFLKVYVRITNVESLLKKTLDTNTENAKFSLIIQAIAEDAGFIMTDGDVAAYFKKYVEAEDYKEYEATYGLPYTRYITLQQFVMDYLVKNAILG